MDSIIFNEVVDYINPGITSLVSTIIIGDYISIDDGFELIQYRVGSVLFGSIYLENMLFLFDANDSVAGHIFEEDGYLVPENIPPDHVGWVATRWITVRELILALAFDGFEVIRVEVNV